MPELKDTAANNIPDLDKELEQKNQRDKAYFERDKIENIYEVITGQR